MLITIGSTLVTMRPAHHCCCWWWQWLFFTCMFY